MLDCIQFSVHSHIHTVVAATFVMLFDISSSVCLLCKYNITPGKPLYRLH